MSYINEQKIASDSWVWAQKLGRPSTTHVKIDAVAPSRKTKARIRVTLTTTSLLMSNIS